MTSASSPNGHASCLYECQVFHRRILPKPNEFLYRIFLFALDLDELPRLPRTNLLLRHNQRGLYSFYDQDHFRMVEGGPRENAEAFLASRGIAEKPARILLLTNLRFCGYTFNPITIWFCLRSDDSPLAAIAEVGNTFGELKPYLVPFQDGAYRLRTPKHFYVSPFSSLDLEFDFRFAPPGPRLSVAIDDYDGEKKVLLSTLTGRRVPLTALKLAALTLKYPFITLKVILLIHWHAFLLWLKKFPFHAKEANPDQQRDLFRPHRSLDDRE